MRILEREAECLDISAVRPWKSYKVIVYQKAGDCRSEGKGSEFCRGDCNSFYMSVELLETEDSVIFPLPEVLLPPFEYFEKNMYVHNVFNLEQLREFSEGRGRPMGAKKILYRGTEIYKGAETLGISKPQCGMEYFNFFLPPETKIFNANASLKESLETYNGIWINMPYFLESVQKNLSDEEMLREASMMTESKSGIGFLLNRFGEDFTQMAVEYREKKKGKC